MATDIIARGMASKSLKLIGSENGLATLDENGKLSPSQFPDSIIGAVTYMGIWDAGLNIPIIPTAAIENKGHYYVVSVAGLSVIDSESNWEIGNWIISDGVKWSKVATQQKVKSVSGKIGAVVLDKTDVGLNNVQNLDTTNASNITSGKLNYERLPIATTSTVGAVKFGDGYTIESDGKVIPKLGTGIKIDTNGTIQIDSDNVDVTLLKNASMLALGVFKNTFDNTISTLTMFSDSKKSDFWVYNGTNSYLLGGYTWNNGDQLWCHTTVIGTPSNLTTNFSRVPFTINQATTSNFGTVKLGNTTPLQDALTGSIGTSLSVAREDHIHPTKIMGASGTTHSAGLVPDTSSTTGTNKYLCENSTWVNPVNGSNGQIQFNNNGILGADSNLSWDNINKRFTNGGYTKLGSEAPAIKFKKITGSTPIAVATTGNYAHGLTKSKILGVQVVVTNSSGTLILPHNGAISDVSYYYAQVTDTALSIYISTSATAILNKPFRAIITYEE